MTGEELRAIRTSAAPDLSQARFAQLLGYADADAYRKYESGARPVPHLLSLLMRMIKAHGLETLHLARGA